VSAALSRFSRVTELLPRFLASRMTAFSRPRGKATGRLPGSMTRATACVRKAALLQRTTVATGTTYEDVLFLVRCRGREVLQDRCGHIRRRFSLPPFIEIQAGHSSRTVVSPFQEIVVWSNCSAPCSVKGSHRCGARAGPLSADPDPVVQPFPGTRRRTGNVENRRGGPRIGRLRPTRARLP
jgi:hypothetical protein